MLGFRKNNLEFRAGLGVATRKWEFRCVEARGTGRRAAAKQWKVGVSGKQNKDFQRPNATEDATEVVSRNLLILFYLIEAW